MQRNLVVNAFIHREVPASGRYAAADEGQWGQGPHLFPGGNRLNLEFGLISFLYSVHNVAGCSGEVSENQRSQIPTAGWTDPSSSKTDLPYFSDTLGQERQELIDKFNRDEQIFIFILSTRAGVPAMPSSINCA